MNNDIGIETEEGKKFLDKYTGAAKRVRKSQLKKYLAYRNMNCEELVDETAEDWERSRRERDFPAEHHITKFEKWLKEEKGHSENTVSNHLAAVRAFYKFNNFPLNSDRLNSRNPSAKPENEAMAIDADKMRKIYNSTTSKRNKALILFLYQTGQSASQISELDYDDVKPELVKEKYPLKISYSGRKGSGLSYCTFLGADGIEALKKYLDDRRGKLGFDKDDNGNFTEDFDSEAPLFAKRNGKDRLTAEAIAETLKYIAKKLSEDIITEQEMERADINPLRPHAFRKNFKTTLVPVANNFAIEYMMGHQFNKVERSYWVDQMGGREGLREYYAREMEPHLSIDVESTGLQVNVSSSLEDDWKEEFKERLGDDIVFKEDYENKVEILEDKWLDSKEENRKQKKELEEVRDELKRKKIDSLYSLRIGFSKEEALEMKEELDEKFDWYDKEDNLLFYGDEETLVSPPPNPGDFSELSPEQISELRDYLQQKTWSSSSSR